MLLPNSLQQPMIAILRGLEPNNAVAIAELLLNEGFEVMEVPLNSPDAYLSIELIKKEFGAQLIIGAGTVLSATQVQDVANAGGEIILSPNMNPMVIQKTKALKLWSFPGVFTPTEAFSALECGADGLKFFPCDVLTPNAIKSYQAVLPKNIITLAVGGIQAENMHQYKAIGISGFGFGSCLFKPEMSLTTVRNNARLLMQTGQLLR